MSHTHSVDTEFGRLRTVLAHRPGAELRRAAASGNDRWLFHGVPWVRGAQAEHDTLTQCLRDHDVEVLYVTELLQDCLEYPGARTEVIASVCRDRRLGAQLAADVGRHLAGLDPEALAGVLVSGLTPEEFRGRGVVYGMLGRHDFVIDPLPHLVFVQDSSVWAGTAVMAARPCGGRRREGDLLGVIYRHHPRFAGVSVLGPIEGELHGGDVLQLAPGVTAVGIGDETSPAAVEHLAGLLLGTGLARAVLAVGMDQLHAGSRLDTICTVIGAGTLLMSPALAYTLQAHTITVDRGLRMSRRQPFLESVARATGAPGITVIGTGAAPRSVARQPWDDSGNALALESGLMVCHERSVDALARLEAAGIGVVRVPCSELGSVRGGPRAMMCALDRDHVRPALAAAPALPAAHAVVPEGRHSSDPALPAEEIGELIALAAPPAAAAEAADLAPAG